MHYAVLLLLGACCRAAQPNTTIAPQPGLPNSIVSNAQDALTFEQSNWANGSVQHEAFYRTPVNSTNLPAGTLLKLETYTNTSLYTVPPQTALSRILFQTKTLNDSLVPASAYVQWPYFPRLQPDGTYPVIVWSHGTSGAFADCAPSHIRNLWYQFTAPFILALQGYVVVAPDYAGLGTSRTSDGKSIIHQYLASPAAANDLFYAVEAAQTAFPQLSKEFVIMGHSQGGTAAWAAAERQVKLPVTGYLGAIAASPPANFLEILELGISLLGTDAALASAAGTIAILAQGVPSVFPDFDIGDVLTPAGVQRLLLLEELQGCNSVSLELFTSNASTPLVQPDVLENGHITAFQSLVASGGKPLAGPMLVLQGTADAQVPVNLTTKYVDLTCDRFPESAIEYVTYDGVAHVPTMYASQRDWLGWIEDRFAGKEPGRCRRLERRSALAQQSYQVDLNWFLEYQTQRFQTA